MFPFFFWFENKLKKVFSELCFTDNLYFSGIIVFYGMVFPDTIFVTKFFLGVFRIFYGRVGNFIDNGLVGQYGPRIYSTY